VVPVCRPEPRPTKIMKMRFAVLTGLWIAAAVGVYALANWLSLPSLVQREFGGMSLQVQPATGATDALPLDKRVATQAGSSQAVPAQANSMVAKKSSEVVSASASRLAKSVTVSDPLYPCSFWTCDPTEPPWCPPPGSREKRPCLLWPPGGRCPPPYLMIVCVAPEPSSAALSR
jgi:hypothetical protein